MNTLKAKTTISCNCCGGKMKRVKSIKVVSIDKESAAIEAKEKLNLWQSSLIGQNCKVCASIIKEVEA